MKLEFTIGFWRSKPDRQKTIYNKEWQVTKHKFLEVQYDREPNCIFDLKFYLFNKNYDHSGITFDFGLLGNWFNITFYDNRHADYYEED